MLFVIKCLPYIDILLTGASAVPDWNISLRAGPRLKYAARGHNLHISRSGLPSSRNFTVTVEAPVNDFFITWNPGPSEKVRFVWYWMRLIVYSLKKTPSIHIHFFCWKIAEFLKKVRIFKTKKCIFESYQTQMNDQTKPA